MGLSNIPQHARVQKPIPPMGIHPAICYAIIDMGVHSESFKGNPPRNVQKLKMCFEFPTLPEQVFDEQKGPQRLSIMQDYNVSTGDKSTLMKMLKQWRNVPEVNLATDLKAYLGAPCTIQVVHTTKDGITYANIAQSGLNVLPPMQALGAPKNPMIFFDTDNFSWPAFHSLWKFVQDKLRSSIEWPTILQKHGNEPAPGQTSTPQQLHQNPVAPQQAFQQPVQQQFQQPVNPAPQFGGAMQPNAQFQQQQVPQQNADYLQLANQAMNPNFVPPAPQQVFQQPTGIVVDNGAPPVF